MAKSVTIVKEFQFDAAHFLPGMADGHRYGRPHGHSFYAEVAISGAVDGTKGWVVDFEDVDKALAEIRADLDHSYLNEIKGLEMPTLEAISAYIWARLEKQFPGLVRITLRRPSCGEACIYEG